MQNSYLPAGAAKLFATLAAGWSSFTGSLDAAGTSGASVGVGSGTSGAGVGVGSTASGSGSVPSAKVAGIPRENTRASIRQRHKTLVNFRILFPSKRLFYLFFPFYSGSQANITVEEILRSPMAYGHKENSTAQYCVDIILYASGYSKPFPEKLFSLQILLLKKAAV